MTDAPAKFDRFDYKQKFEYWGLVLGAVIVISTGLVLLFPILVDALPARRARARPPSSRTATRG